MMCKIFKEAYWFFLSQIRFVKPPTPSITLFNRLCLDHDNPSPFQLVEYSCNEEVVHICSSVFVLLFCGFDTFHTEGKMGMVCRTFATLTFFHYLILHDLTERHVSNGSQPWLVLLLIHHFSAAMMFL